MDDWWSTDLFATKSSLRPRPLLDFFDVKFHQSPRDPEENEYVLELALPGIKTIDVQVFREGQKLVVMWISRLGETREESMVMPMDAKLKEASCTLRDGLLSVTIPALKRDEVHPSRKSIPISG